MSKSKKKRNNKIKKRQAQQAQIALNELHGDCLNILNGWGNALLHKLFDEEAFVTGERDTVPFLIPQDTFKSTESQDAAVLCHVQLDMDAESQTFTARPLDPSVFTPPDQDPKIFLSLDKISLTDQQIYMCHLMVQDEFWQTQAWERVLGISSPRPHTLRNQFFSALRHGDLDAAWPNAHELATMILESTEPDSLADPTKLWHINEFTGDATLPAVWHIEIDACHRTQWVIRDKRSDEAKRKQLACDFDIQTQWLQTHAGYSEDSTESKFGGYHGPEADRFASAWTLVEDIKRGVNADSPSIPELRTKIEQATRDIEELERRSKALERDNPDFASTLNPPSLPSSTTCSTCGPTNDNFKPCLTDQASPGQNSGGEDATTIGLGLSFDAMHLLPAEPIRESSDNISKRKYQAYVEDGTDTESEICPEDLQSLEYLEIYPEQEDRPWPSRHKDFDARSAAFIVATPATAKAQLLVRNERATMTEPEPGFGIGPRNHFGNISSSTSPHNLGVGAQSSSQSSSTGPQTGSAHLHRDERSHSTHEAALHSPNFLRLNNGHNNTNTNSRNLRGRMRQQQQQQQQQQHEENKARARADQRRSQTQQMYFFACHGIDEVLDLGSRAETALGRDFVEDSDVYWLQPA